MNRLRLLAVVVVGFLLNVSAAQANEAVAVDAANPPFMYEANGKASGIYPALVAEVFQRIGVPATVTPVPWKRAIAMIDDGQSAVAGIYKNEERLKKYDYSDLLFNEEMQIFVPAGKTFAFTGVDALKGKTVGVIAGWSYGDDFDAARAKGDFKVEEVASDILNFKKLAGARVDAVLAIRESAAIALTDGDVKGKVEALPTVFSTNPSYIAFAKKADKGALITQINDALKAMHTDGSFDKVVSSVLAH